MDMYPEFRKESRAAQSVMGFVPGYAYYAVDISGKGLVTAERQVGRRFTRKVVASLMDSGLVDPETLAFAGPPYFAPPKEEGGTPIGPVDLVLAVEVLLHIPPEGLSAAVYNLLAAASAASHGASRPYGRLITCDWTHIEESRSQTDAEAFEARANANGNWRHDYPKAFAAAGAKVLEARRVGLQTIFVVQP
jgi:hypothetical protein